MTHRDPARPHGQADDGSERRARWDERHAARDPIESREPEPALADAIAGLPPGRALDLATGDGRNAVWLATRGWRVTAVDFSRVGLERAAARATREGVPVEWVLADLTAWRPPARAFDLVSFIFLHLPDEERRPIYAAAAEAIAPGGTILVLGHDTTNLSDGTGGPQDPAVLFTAADIAAELGDGPGGAGLEIVRAERRVRTWDDGGRGIDALVVARRPGA